MKFLKNSTMGKRIRRSLATAAATSILLTAFLGGTSAMAADTTADGLQESIRNNANLILNAYVKQEIKNGMSVEELQKAIPKLGTVPSGINLAIVYTPESLPAFSLCGWGLNVNKWGNDMSDAYAYKSPSDQFSPMGIDCSPNGVDAQPLTSKTGVLTAVARPDNSKLNFPAATPSTEVAQAPAQEVAPAPVVKTPAEPVVIPWGGIIIAALVLVGIAVLLGLVYATYSVSRKVKRQSQNTEKNIEQWNNLIERCDKIIKEWASYELDTVKIIDLPLLSDMREKSTINFHAALRQAKALRPENVKRVSEISAIGSPFDAAVEDLEATFHIAETEAKRIRWNNFSADERKRLQKAKDLLNIAMNGAASDNERQSAYKRMQKELSGLIVVPKANILALEKKINLLLTDGSDDVDSDQSVNLTK